MPAIADIGSLLEVTPRDDIWVKTSADGCEYVRDLSPFQMRVTGVIHDHGRLIGVYGAVVGGSEPYQRLIASLLVRLDGSDWTQDRSTQANFKVGPVRVERVSAYDYRDPHGTEIAGFPVIGRFGNVEVLSGEQDGAANRSQPVGPEANRTSPAAGSGG